jgi:N-acetylmuramoyl-L-alanine amidase
MALGGVLLLALLWTVLPWAQSTAEQKQVAVFAAKATYSLPVVTRDGREYVGLAELLEPLGSVNASPEGRKWKLRFNDIEAQFQSGKSRAKVARSEVEIGGPFLMEGGRGLVPLSTLPQLLAGLLPDRPILFHAAARRLFLDRTEVHFSAELKRGAASQLQFTFSAPVNPFIATEPGKLRMVFQREGVVGTGPSESQSFPDKTISSLTYDEGNGTAEITVNSPMPLSAFFSGDRKTVTVAPEVAPQPAQGKGSAQPSPAPAAVTAGGKPGVKAAKPSGLPAARGFLVVIDAAHGGTDRGGTITDDLAEKDVALAFARRLRNELQNRGITSRLIRDGDGTIPLEQRAATANAAMPSLYLAVHAAGSGSGVHIFASNLVPLGKTVVFLPWDSAQAAYIQTSREVAGALADEFLKRDIPAITLAVPVAPLNSIAAPALAIEVAAPAGRAVEDISSAAYQQSVCGAIATAVAGVRSRLPYGGATP